MEKRWPKKLEYHQKNPEDNPATVQGWQRRLEDGATGRQMEETLYIRGTHNNNIPFIMSEVSSIIYCLSLSQSDTHSLFFLSVIIENQQLYILTMFLCQENRGSIMKYNIGSCFCRETQQRHLCLIDVNDGMACCSISEGCLRQNTDGEEKSAWFMLYWICRC